VDDATAPATTITMNGNYTIQANFTEVGTNQLTVTSGPGGNVTDPGEGTFPYTTGAVVDLLAVPDLGFVFGNWTGDVSTVADANAADTTITMNADYAIQANFAESGGPTPTPTPEATPTPTPEATPTPTPEATPTPTPEATPTPTPTPAPTSSPPPGGGGGGGGGVIVLPTSSPAPTPGVAPTSAPTAAPTVPPTPTAAPTAAPTGTPAPGEDVLDLSDVIDADGVVHQTVVYTSPDGGLEIVVGSGTGVLTPGDEPVSALTVEKVCNDIPPPPFNAYIVGCAFDIGPDGTTFDPPIEITLHYDPAQVPDGVAEEDLVVAYYNIATGQWVILPSSVDTVGHTITATVDHLTLFAVYASSGPGPAPTAQPDTDEEISIWIIVGPVIAVILLGVIAFVLVRRRRSEGSASAESGGADQDPPWEEGGTGEAGESEEPQGLQP
jgi:hypothetical protein